MPLHKMTALCRLCEAQSPVIPRTALNDLQQQIKEQQNKTDRETVSLENTIRETYESEVFYDCCEVSSTS